MKSNNKKRLKYIVGLFLILIISLVSKQLIAASTPNYYEIYKESISTFMSRNNSDLGKKVNTPSSPSKFTDYGAYVLRYGGIWCTSENSENNKNQLEIREIIDLKADGTVKIIKKGTDRTDKAHKKAAAKAAYIIDYWQNKKSDSWYQAASGWRFYKLVDRQGIWKYIYNYFGDNMTNADADLFEPDRGKLMNGVPTSVKNASEDYATFVKKDHSMTLSGNAKLYNGNFKTNGDGKSWQTKISGYNIGNLELSSKRISVSIEINNKTYNIKENGSYYYLYSGNNIKGRLVVSSSNIYLSDSISEVSEKIKITKTITGIRARIILLGGNATQTRGIARARKESYNLNGELNPPSPANVDVSLQKYIINVNGNSLTNNETSLTSRMNKKTSTSETNTSVKDRISTDNTTTNNYKGNNNNIVKIEVGDTVTYKICVYNNSENNATSITVTDTLPPNIGDAISISHGNYFNRYTKNGQTLTIYLTNLPAGENTYIDVTVKYNTYTTSVLTNSAWISNTSPANSTSYRTVDRDYVKMKDYEVKLEKSICKVSSQNGYMGDIYEASRYKSINKYAQNKNRTDYDEIVKHLRIKSDINSDGKLDSNDITILSNYLKISNMNNTNVSTSISWINAYDLNKDGNVTIEDIYLYRMIKEGLLNEDTLNRLQQYTNLDINNDGIVDNNDIIIYKVLRSDINGDGEINDNDILTLKLANLDTNQDGKINNDDISILKTYYIYKMYGNSEMVNKYSQSDINNNGIVDINDELIFTYINEYYKNSEITNEEFNELKEGLRKYEINGDGSISKVDANIVRNWIKGEYEKVKSLYETELSQVSKEDLENLSEIEWIDLTQYTDEEKEQIVIGNKIDAFIEEIQQESNKDNKDRYDLNNDNKINEDDINLLTEFYGINQALLDQELLDVNGDGNIDINDVETQSNEETIYVKNNIEKFIENYNIINGKINIISSEQGYQINIDTATDGYVDENDYIAYEILCGEKVYNEKMKDLTSILDINLDGMVSEEDQNIYNDIIARNININEEYLKKDFIESIGDIIEDYQGIDINKVKNVNVDDMIAIINGNSDEETEIDDSSDNNTVAFNEVNDVETTEGNQQYDLNNDGQIDNLDLEILNLYLSMDLNGDSKVDKEDISILEGYIKEISSISKTDKETYLKNNSAPNCTLQDIIDMKNISNFDINDDGKVNEQDYELLKEYLNSDDINTNILNITEANIKSIIGIDVNSDGVTNDEDLELIKIYDEYSAKTDSSGYKKLDINEDGIINESDLNLLQEIIITQRDDMQSISYSLQGITEADRGTTNYQRAGKDGNGYAPEYTDNKKKYNNVVEVNKGDTVRYKIEVTNIGTDNSYGAVRIEEIKDTLTRTYNEEVTTLINGNSYNDLSNTFLNLGESATFYIYYKVNDSNILLDLYKNTAEIKVIRNKNNVNVTSADDPSNNIDSDYFQLKDITISGTVWNDKALNKTNDNYNGKQDYYFDDKGDLIEKGLPNVKVYLYRDGEDVIATTTTDENGKYNFRLNYIKGPKQSSTNRWSGDYYEYYVVFEYDGIKYTPTPDGKTCVDITNSTAYSNEEYKINSNAKENNGPVKETRENFNDRFSKVNSTGASKINESEKTNISYNTENEKGYIPQSNYVYNSETMSMQSSTNKISLSNNTNLEKQLQYVNLGLRGRDIFDLELTSDVDNVKVTVNNQQGVYNYTNKVNIRNQDVRAQNIKNGEDMAHTVSETMNSEDPYVEERQDEEGAQIGKTDITASKAYTKTNNYDYSESQGLQDVRVTYKITVTNASQTAGTATKVINYYDKVYKFITLSITDKDGNKLSYAGLEGEPDTSNSKYNKIIITPQDRTEYEKIMLEQGDSYYIYVTLGIEDIDGFRAKLMKDNKIPTYNMAEIYEYRTQSGNGQTEFTRGLIDKDSAPGNVIKKEVCHENNERAWIDKNISTVDYYFAAKNLNLLKYEDDTYATPTLYFTAVDRERKIEGTVFEDYTKIIDNNGDNKIRTKTGDGKQTGDEPGIKGAYVALFELVEEENMWYPRYHTTTNASGHFEFNGFLPGIYMIRYRYGNLYGTFVYNNNPNTKSYNGEDFQSTNNTGKYGDTEADWIYKLNSTPNYWYVYNEKDGISTATDMDVRRKEISTNVTNFTDEQMTGLNNARDGKTLAESNVKFLDKDGNNIGIMGATSMYAQTNSMILTLEKTVQTGENSTKQNDSFLDYTVSNMNFGIAEVPVTTIDLQKHVKSFTIKDSAGNNTIASAEIDKDNTSVTVNASKIAVNRLDTVIKVLSENLEMSTSKVKGLINYNVNKTVDSNIVIKEKVSEEQMKKLRDAMTQNSLAREINIVNAWKVTSGNVLAAPGTSVIDVSIEDEKLQGAKLEVTYEITCSMYAEKNFNNDAVTIPSITGMADYIDNDLSYNTSSNSNNSSWTVTTREDVVKLYEEAAKFKDISKGDRLGTLDSDGTKYTAIVSANDNNKLLLTECGTGTAEITLERVLSTSDSSLASIITSSINSFEYDNNIEITGLNYENTKSENTGDFVYRDRVRTTDRYIILAGIQHDFSTSETIAIHPPTGENNNMIYYVIASISIGILSVGIILIKKYAIKRNDKK